MVSLVKSILPEDHVNTLTLKIPQALDDALQIASRRRQITKSAVVRDALERTLSIELKQLGPAAA